MAQAAVEDADEPVREGSKGLVVASSAGALTVVVGAGARRVRQGAECVLVERVGEAPVAGVAG